METVIEGTEVLPLALLRRLAELELTAEGVRVGGRRVTAGGTHRLVHALSRALYERWHAAVAGEAGSRRMPRRSPDAERELEAAVPHTGTPATAVVRGTAGDVPDGPVVVEFGRVRVQVPADAVQTHRDEPPVEPGRRVTVRVPAVRPALSPGFLLVHGPRGGLADRREVLRLYVHVTEFRHAAALWGATLAVLAEAGVRYQAKVLSRPWSYPRQDAMVVYLEADDGPVALRVAERLQGMSGLGVGTSCFAHRVAPGLALAFDPRDPQEDLGRQSFGQHRALAVAKGVLRHAADPEGTELTAEVARELRGASADPSDPARNLGSPRLPVPARRGA